jgi:hypothetical protein
MFIDARMRHSFLHFMPVPWQDKFEDAYKKTTYNMTLHHMQDYIQPQAEKGPYYFFKTLFDSGATPEAKKINK